MLPATTFWERNDVHTPWAGAGHYAIYMRQAIAPMYECRNDIDIFAELARRVGIDGYSDKSEEAWLRELTKERSMISTPSPSPASPASRPPRTRSPLPRQIRDPDNHKFPTPSGKIEIYSTALAAQPDPYGLGRHSADPDLESPPDAEPRYTLGAVHAEIEGAHPFDPRQPAGVSRASTATMSGSPEDAAARGIADGQGARVQRTRRHDAARPGHRPHRARRRLDQGGRVVHPGRAAPTRKAAPTC